MSSIKLSALAERLGVGLRGDGDAEVSGCAGLDAAVAGQLSFLNHPRYAPLLSTTAATAVILSPADADRAPRHTALLIADDPYFAFRQAMALLHGFRTHPEVGVHPLAFIHDSAVLGDRVVIYPHVYVGPHAVIGHDCVLYPGVCIYDHCVLGDRVTLHANTVVGQDGLGYATAPTGTSSAPESSNANEIIHHKMPQVGNAVIEDDVEIGANCSIDRATLGSTVVGRGSKLSNNVVVGHGVKLGRHNMIVAHVGIAGSTTTGDYVTMGGQVGLAGHLKIGHRVTIAADAKVMTDIPDGETWGGTPAMPLPDAKRIVLNQKRLPGLVSQLKTLEKRLAALEAESAAKRQQS